MEETIIINLEEETYVQRILGKYFGKCYHSLFDAVYLDYKRLDKIGLSYIIPIHDELDAAFELESIIVDDDNNIIITFMFSGTVG
jgi:hypothetical protein